MRSKYDCRCELELAWSHSGRRSEILHECCGFTTQSVSCTSVKVSDNKERHDPIPPMSTSPRPSAPWHSSPDPALVPDFAPALYLVRPPPLAAHPSPSPRSYCSAPFQSAAPCPIPPPSPAFQSDHTAPSLADLHSDVSHVLWSVPVPISVYPSQTSASVPSAHNLEAVRPDADACPFSFSDY